MRWLDSITDAMNMNLGKLWEMVEGQGVLQSLSLQRVRPGWVTEQQQVSSLGHASREKAGQTLKVDVCV